MRRVNVGFTSGLFGTQTSGGRTPVGGSPRFVPGIWTLGRVIGTFATALTLMALVWFNGPVAAGAVVVGSSSPIHDRPVAEYVPVEFTSGVKAEDLNGYTLADLRLANAHFSPSLVPWALRTSYCESRHQDDQVGAAGERGRWQINADVWLGLNGWPGDGNVREIVGRHGPVTPQTLALPEANAEVTNYIVTVFGASPWATSEGCDGWR